jgi:hypothetical protein
MKKLTACGLRSLGDIPLVSVDRQGLRVASTSRSGMLDECKGSADLQILEPAIQPAEDGGVVPADEEDLVALQIEVAVQRSD